MSNPESPVTIFFGFVMTVLVNALAFFLFSKLLDSSGLAENTLSWHAAAAGGAIFVGVRVWNAALFSANRRTG